jgi:hypothetical protein
MNENSSTMQRISTGENFRAERGGPFQTVSTTSHLFALGHWHPLAREQNLTVFGSSVSADDEAALLAVAKIFDVTANAPKVIGANANLKASQSISSAGCLVAATQPPAKGAHPAH